VRPALWVGSAVSAILGITTMVACKPIPDQPPDILLITIDTLRADALEPYGAIDTRTPSIAAVAERGVVYEAATTPIPLTRPAHASILTGLYPDQHGVLKNRQVLSENVETLAEILSDSGYQTAGFTGVRFLDLRSGLQQGFAHFEAPQKTKSPRARKVVERAIDWLEAADQDSPAFMWIHVYDPHQPYDPPRKYRDGIDGALMERIPAIGWKSLDRESNANDGDVPEQILELALSYYQREIEYTDFWIGQLVESFDRLRNPRPSMVIVTADHGECFENGNYFEHADCLLEGALQVPLIVRYPRNEGAGLRIDRRVSNLDIFSTVLHELSIPEHSDSAGIPLQTDLGSTTERRVLVRAPDIGNPDHVPSRLKVIRSVAGDPVAPFTDPRTCGVVYLRWKYLWAPGSESLFKLPDEKSNHAETEPEIRTRLYDALKADQKKYSPVASADEDMDPDTLEALEALGYVQ
jgi:arylsulfatase A-like enzyme